MNKFSIFKGKLIQLQKETVNTGSKKFFKIQVDFDNEWLDNYPLRFLELYQNVNDNHIALQFLTQDNIVEIPTELLSCDLPIFVGVFAENDKREVVANTNFLKIDVDYGANTSKKIVFPTESNEVTNLYSSDSRIKYIRLSEGGKLQYSNDNKTWVSLSNAMGGGLDQEEVEQIVDEKTKDFVTNEQVQEKVQKVVEEETKDLPTDIDATIDELSYSITIDLKDKNGNVVSRKTVTLPIKDVDLSEYVKNTDYANGWVNSPYTKDGIVTVFPYGNGGISVASGDIKGRIAVVKALQSHIDERYHSFYEDANTFSPNFCRPIVPSNVDYAFKAVLTDSKLSWTNEEKASSCETIGAARKEYVESLVANLQAQIDELKGS